MVSYVLWQVDMEKMLEILDMKEVYSHEILKTSSWLLTEKVEFVIGWCYWGIHSLTVSPTDPDNKL